MLVNNQMQNLSMAPKDLAGTKLLVITLIHVFCVAISVVMYFVSAFSIVLKVGKIFGATKQESILIHYTNNKCKSYLTLLKLIGSKNCRFTTISKASKNRY